MAKANSSSTTKTPAAPALSFTDAYGAMITIPAGGAQDYAGVKSEQLRAITRMLATDFELDRDLERLFQVIANGLAGEVDQLLYLVAKDAENMNKAEA